RCKSTIPDQKNYLTPGGHFAALIGGHFDRYMQNTEGSSDTLLTVKTLSKNPNLTPLKPLPLLIK
ncbi:hypothetical protein, partial [Belliella buryatensis]|uniref:hypothetical protein n=1 Tax=Belliella buryatensis TaxID=1500549 RepID=UPI001BB0C52C